MAQRPHEGAELDQREGPAVSTALDRWRAGATPDQFTQAEASALAEHLMQRHDAYRNRKHPDHQAVSLEVSELMQRAHPGTLGPSGELLP